MPRVLRSAPGQRIPSSGLRPRTAILTALLLITGAQPHMRGHGVMQELDASPRRTFHIMAPVTKRTFDVIRAIRFRS